MPPISPATLGRMYDAYGAALVLYARQWLDDRSAAEDVVQEAFVRLVAQPALPRNARAWLYAVVRNGAQRRAAVCKLFGGFRVRVVCP